MQIKAWACEFPSVHQLPLSRWSTTDLAREVCQTGLVASISGSTLWRWLHHDAIRPWYHRSWIFPKDPDFGQKAGRLLDLYSRQWEDKPLKTDEFVICADEKTSIQARRRLHPSEPCKPGRAARVENRYKRGGAWVYLSALDVHNARVFGRCEAANGIAPFDSLVEQVMTRPPYNDARRVFWIVDNCSVHRGQKLWSACVRDILGVRSCNSFMPPLTRVGSIRLRFTFRSCNERSSPRMISRTWMSSLSACSIFNTTGNRWRSRSIGSSHART